MKNFFLIFFITLLVVSCSNPIDQAKQTSLIETNEIRVGMNCQNLTKLLGGYRAISYLYLEKKGLATSLQNSFLLSQVHILPLDDLSSFSQVEV